MARVRQGRGCVFVHLDPWTVWRSRPGIHSPHLASPPGARLLRHCPPGPQRSPAWHRLPCCISLPVRAKGPLPEAKVSSGFRKLEPDFSPGEGQGGAAGPWARGCSSFRWSPESPSSPESATCKPAALNVGAPLSSQVTGFVSSNKWLDHMVLLFLML